MRRGIALAVVLASAPAHADDVDDLVAAGQGLAKDGEYSRAIVLFKQADAKRPRALHACLIALSYTRRELWAQAELFASQCHARATSFDKLPEWVTDLDDTITKKRDALGVAAITFRVEPPVEGALLALSSFEPDETFAPRTLHLARGTYTAIVTAPGHARATQTFEVAARGEQTVTIRLGDERRGARRSRALPWLLVAGGAALAGAGLAYDLVALEPVRTALANAAAASPPDLSTYVTNSARFDHRQAAVIALYAAGGVAIAAGLVLRFTVYKRADNAVAVTPRGLTIAGTM